jgi:hypothetical protein
MSPATWEAEVAGSLSEANLGKSARANLRNKLKTKELGHSSVVSGTPLASMTPTVNPQDHQKEKK